MTVPMDIPELDAEDAPAELDDPDAVAEDEEVEATEKAGEETTSVVGMAGLLAVADVTRSESVLAPWVPTVAAPDILGPETADGMEDTCRRCTRCILAVICVCVVKERKGERGLRRGREGNGERERRADDVPILLRAIDGDAEILAQSTQQNEMMGTCCTYRRRAYCIKSRRNTSRLST